MRGMSGNKPLGGLNLHLKWGLFVVYQQDNGNICYLHTSVPMSKCV